VADEAVEQGARRCLRFANRVGNAGEGPLEMRLTGVEAAKAVAGQGKHVQRIHNSDGTYTDREAGVANYHTTHEHFHFMNLVEFRLHKYDAVSDTRGERIGGAYKTGICLMDIGLIALGMPHTSLPNWDVTCFYAGAQQEWNMSLSPNWFDLYGAYNHENYVDITNVPDGVYELVATSNVDGRVAESDVTDNEGSVVIQLKGNQVSVLKERKGSEWAAASP
jgi:hypothetical protein